MNRTRKILILIIFAVVLAVPAAIFLPNVINMLSVDVFSVSIHPASDLNYTNTEYTDDNGVLVPNTTGVELNKEIALNARVYAKKGVLTRLDLEFKGEWSSENTLKEHPAVVLFHGLTRSMADLDEIARKLGDLGYICLTIDFRGHGKSTGEFPFNDPGQYNVSFYDALGAYMFLSNISAVNNSYIYSFGHSMGGGAALFLALENFTRGFCVWYPASAYVLRNAPLYSYVSDSPIFHGYIIQGTEDECTRCNPEYTQLFVDNNNPNVELKWIEGGKHGASPLEWPIYVDSTINWFKNELK